jgi:hypothetical protein
VTLTGVVHYTDLGVPAPIAVGIDRIVELRGWSDAARGSFTAIIKLGALSGLTSVILVMMLGQTRIFYAMSTDGLLPWFQRTHEVYKTPHIATIVTGVFVALAGGVFPMHIVGELVSIGTLLAFVLVCLGVPLLRRSNPDQARPFKVRWPWFVGVAGAIACVWVMIGLPADTWLRLVLWLLVGYAVFAGYGVHRSTLRDGAPLSPGWYAGQLGVVLAGVAMTFAPASLDGNVAFGIVAAVAASAFGIAGVANGRVLMRSPDLFPQAGIVWVGLVVAGSVGILRGLVQLVAIVG